MAGIISEKSESSLAPSHSFCRCTFWRGTTGGLEAKLQAEGPGKILLADVRSYGYYSAAAVRIPGSIRIEPNNLSAEIKQFPRNKDMYLYLPRTNNER
jgi:hypothetical protein